MKNLNLSTLTMNASGPLIQKIPEYAHLFDKVIICEGDMTEQAKRIYEDMPRNIHVVDMPWDDSYVKRYEKTAELTDEGSWILHLDDDEIPSPKLLTGLKGGDLRSGSLASKYIDLFRLPCVLHITEDDKKYYPVEEEVRKPYKGQWTKNILYKKTEGLYFRHFGSHVIPENKSQRYDTIQFPYYHMKSLKSFAYNDVWQAFLSPEGQGYNAIEAAQFGLYTSKYKTVADFKKATYEGTWIKPLEHFAWAHRHDYDRPISRLFMVYCILENHHPMRQSIADWVDVKKHILSKECNELFAKNKEEGVYIEV